MWIRSQDLTVLAKARGIYIDSRCSIWSDGLLLGEYSTMSKAISVLQMIQAMFPYCDDDVFQMPQDEYVEDIEMEEIRKMQKMKSNADMRKLKRMVQTKKEVDEFVKKLKEQEQ